MNQKRQQSEPSVSLGDLMADRALDITAIVFPEGAEQQAVSWVHATEQLDPRPHLRPNELVCTLGSALVRRRAAQTFVSALVTSGVAGLALGLGEVHLEAPRELVSACERASLPLLLLSHGVPFLAVNDAVLERRNQHESEVRKRESVLLSTLLTMARSGSNEEELLDRAGLALAGQLNRVRPRSLGDEHIIEWADDSPGPSAAFLAQLESLLEFSDLEQERESSEQQLRLGQLVGLIADGLAHPAALLSEVQLRGLDPSRLMVSTWPSGSEGAVARRWPNGLLGVTSRGVVLVSEEEQEASLRSVGLVCGYSSLISLPELRRALSESRSALRLARSRGGVAGPEQFASLEALLEQQSGEHLMSFIEQLLSPIERADNDGRGDLMNTLKTFIHLERHLQSTADRLYVHVNTVRHRLTRIQELSGRDPFSLSGIIDLKIALWAAERRRLLGHRLIRPLQ